MRWWTCANCGLPDPYHGDGDGIGSCECPRCEYCGDAPLTCSCESDREYYGADEDDPEDAYRPVVTVDTKGLT